jgi:hypothetical protein
MSEVVTISLPYLSALNLWTLADARLVEIEKLAQEYPDLPMRDAQTIASYQAAKVAIEAVLPAE